MNKNEFIEVPVSFVNLKILLLRPYLAISTHHSPYFSACQVDNSILL